MTENKSPDLFFLLLGCKPPGRHTEQHDIYISAANELKELVPEITAFWPEAPKIHIDAWRRITEVNGYRIRLVPKNTEPAAPAVFQLFFLNLGGYQRGLFEELHYRMLVVAEDKGDAVNQAKASAFYQHTGFSGAVSHIDDKYGVDVDDVYTIEEILPDTIKQRFSVQITPAADLLPDEWHLGYTKLSSLISV
jgi:hypothetical protein